MKILLAVALSTGFILTGCSLGAANKLSTEEAAVSITKGMPIAATKRFLGTPANKRDGRARNLKMLTWNTADGKLQVVFLRKVAIRDCSLGRGKAPRRSSCQALLALDRSRLPKLPR